jgi:hypothetical protein
LLAGPEVYEEVESECTILEHDKAEEDIQWVGEDTILNVSQFSDFKGDFGLTLEV